MTSRHRAHDDIHYSAAIMVMFAECFWTFTVELQGCRRGVREGAVARIALDIAVDGDVFPEFTRTSASGMGSCLSTRTR